MLPFVDRVAAPAAILGLLGIAWFKGIVRRIPSGKTFLLSETPPGVGSPQRVVPVFAVLWVMGTVLWAGGRISHESEAHFFGLLLLVSGQLIWIVGLLLSRQIVQSVGTIFVDVKTDPFIEITRAGQAGDLGPARAVTRGAD